MLRSFAKFREKNISFALSVCLSAHMEQICSHLNSLEKDCCFSIFDSWNGSSIMIIIKRTVVFFRCSPKYIEDINQIFAHMCFVRKSIKI